MPVFIAAGLFPRRHLWGPSSAVTRAKGGSAAGSTARDKPGSSPPASDGP